jgi:hypothetical protein
VSGLDRRPGRGGRPIAAGAAEGQQRDHEDRSPKEHARKGEAAGPRRPWQRPEKRLLFACTAKSKEMNGLAGRMERPSNAKTWTPDRLPP